MAGEPSGVLRPRVSEVRAAAKMLDGVSLHTQLFRLPGEGQRGDVWIKPEIHQPAGSFKIRGVYHAVARLSETARAPGIATVSAGNTARALAWCGRTFGVEARSLMPDSAPRAKVDAVRALGGTPVLVPVEEVFRYLRDRGWENEPQAFVHPWTERDVMIGHGTLALELLEDLPQLETIFVPVGGGGLLAGVGSVLRELRPDVRIVAVEPEGCPALHAALEAGRPVTVDCDTMCDGVAVPYVTEEMFPLLAELVDRSVLVSEARVRSAIRELVARGHVVAEGSGALALAAALGMEHAERGVSACLLTGGAIDPHMLAGILTEAEPES